MTAQPLTAEQAQRIHAAFLNAMEWSEALPANRYETAWAYLSGALESMCRPHVDPNSFPHRIPKPSKETQQ